MLREWSLSGQPPIFEEIDYPIGWSLFWYCSSCSKKYAIAFVEGQPWLAIGGCCPKCKGSRYSLPGSLETIRLAGWQVPLEVLNYQVEVELNFLNHPDHPYNEKENKNESISL